MFNKHVGSSPHFLDFSCALGGCESNDPPCLTKMQLWGYFEADHGIVHRTQEIIGTVEVADHHWVQHALIPVETMCRLCAPQLLPIRRPNWPRFDAMIYRVSSIFHRILTVH